MSVFCSCCPFKVLNRQKMMRVKHVVVPAQRAQQDDGAADLMLSEELLPVSPPTIFPYPSQDSIDLSLPTRKENKVHHCKLTSLAVSHLCDFTQNQLCMRHLHTFLGGHGNQQVFLSVCKWATHKAAKNSSRIKK